MSGFGHLLDRRSRRYTVTPALTRDSERGDDAVPDLPGLELGLFTVSRVAQFLDHRVEVRSEVGWGSRSCRGGGEPFP
jgi:signal transduction histidine kinase